MTDDEYYNNKEFCPIPWTSFFVWPDGRVDNCCASHNNIGNLNLASIDNILQGKKSITIKQKILEGNPSKGCHPCYPNDNNKLYNNFDYKRTWRHDFLVNFENYNKDVYNDVDNFEYRYADIRFRTTCNYACVYCSPMYSSLWAEELKVRNSLSIQQIQELNDFFLKNIHTIKSVYLAGGEPLLIKENIGLLKTLYDHNPDCRVTINTNLSYLKENEIFELLCRFKNCHWRVSVDDIGEKYNYIRYPGNWDNFFQNLILLKDKVGVEQISFSMVYTALNAKSVFDAINFISNYGFKKDSFDLFWVNGGQLENGLTSGISGLPIALDPRNLPKKYIDETIKIIQNNLINEERFDKNLNALLNGLQNEIAIESTLLTELNILDSRRKLDSKKIFPDIYEAFNYEL